MSTQTADAATAPQARRGREFRYESYRIDPASGLLSCRYSLDGRPFGERVTFHPMGQARWDSPAVAAAARLVFLLAGVSAYKTAAPPVINTGETALTRGERDFLGTFYTDGLGEFAYRNGIDLSGLRIEGPAAPEPPVLEPTALDTTAPDTTAPDHRAGRRAPGPGAGRTWAAACARPVRWRYRLHRHRRAGPPARRRGAVRRQPAR